MQKKFPAYENGDGDNKLDTCQPSSSILNSSTPNIIHALLYPSLLINKFAIEIPTKHCEYKNDTFEETHIIPTNTYIITNKGGQKIQ